MINTVEFHELNNICKGIQKLEWSANFGFHPIGREIF